MCDVTYNTAFNTVGVGDPVPYGLNSFGSGDRFDLGPNFNNKKKKGKSYSQYNYNPSKSTMMPFMKKSAYSGIEQRPLLVYSKNKKKR